MKKPLAEIKDYDTTDTTPFIDPSKPLKLADLGFELPKENPTRVVSLRLPTQLYNDIRSFSTSIDMPYQAYIKYVLSRAVGRERPVRKAASRGRRRGSPA